MTTGISTEVQKKVHRGKFGKWVFCLARIDHKRFPGRFELADISQYSNEASALIFYRKYLDMGSYYLIKLPSVMAQVMRKQSHLAEHPEDYT